MDVALMCNGVCAFENFEAVAHLVLTLVHRECSCCCAAA